MPERIRTIAKADRVAERIHNRIVSLPTGSIVLKIAEIAKILDEEYPGTMLKTQTNQLMNAVDKKIDERGQQ